MATILDYVRQAHSPLQADLSPTDALALTCLVYVDFHALPGPRSPRGCLLREVAQASSVPSLYRYSLASHADRPLLESAGASARFGGLRVRDAVTRLTSRPLAQFGAVTFVDEAGATQPQPVCVGHGGHGPAARPAPALAFGCGSRAPARRHFARAPNADW